MTRVLILFTAESIKKKYADPAALKALLEKEAGDTPVQVDTATYDELVCDLRPGHAKLFLHTTGRDVAEYDVVYLRRIKEATAGAITAGIYCKAKGIPVIDRELANRPGSMGKQTQYMRLALANMPFPATLYSPSHEALLRAFDASDMSFPLILKSVSGSRGSDNYLIASRDELHAVCAAHPTVHFLIQEYVPNSGDYRVWVCGDTIGPILYRSRTSGHTNNTSLGGRAKLVPASTLPADVLEDCKRAAKLFDRDIAGVDVVFEHDTIPGRHYLFEVNRAPQVEHTPFENVKAAAMVTYMLKQAKDAQRG